MMEKFTFFLKGPLSQWYGPLKQKNGSILDDSRFVIDNIEYNCCEQFMMAEKARLFNDDETLEKILAATHPREQKSLGRQVKYFDKIRWELVARDIVYRGNEAKFTQNPHLLRFLLKTAGTTLVEVNPRDSIWGIGLEEGDPRTLTRETWQGKNWLGEVLTNLRDYLLDDQMNEENANTYTKDIQSRYN